MYSEIKKNDILSQGPKKSVVGNEEKPNSKVSESPQINANEKFNGRRRESGEAKYSKRSPKRKFPTDRNRRQDFQTKSRRISN